MRWRLRFWRDAWRHLELGNGIGRAVMQAERWLKDLMGTGIRNASEPGAERFNWESGM